MSVWRLVTHILEFGAPDSDSSSEASTTPRQYVVPPRKRKALRVEPNQEIQENVFEPISDEVSGEISPSMNSPIHEEAPESIMLSMSSPVHEESSEAIQEILYETISDSEREEFQESHVPVQKAINDEICKVTPEEETNCIEFLWQDGDPDEILSTIGRIQLSRYDFETLKDQEWLNDKIIDAYMELIMQRSKKRSLPKIYAFSTYFYTALKTKGYSGVARWTSKIDIFSYDILFIPIHSGEHWTLLVFDRKRNCFTYLDSMAIMNINFSNSEAKKHIQKFADYLERESMEKRQIPYDRLSARMSHFKNLPMQNNEFDCGVFMCTYAENIARKTFRQFSFDQSDIHWLRRKMCFELGTGLIFEHN